MALTPTSRGIADIAKVSPHGKVAGHAYGSFTPGTTTDTVVWKDSSTGSTLLTLVVTYTDSGKGTLSHWDWIEPA